MLFFLRFFFCFLGETLRTGPQPQVPATQTNNHQSGFKRQNTVDSATIKENSARHTTRPASAQAKTVTENSKSLQHIVLYKCDFKVHVFQQIVLVCFYFS